MFSWRTTTFVGLYCLFMMVGNGGGCHSTFPEGDQTEIVEPVTCAVSSDPFGTFGPAPGSIVGHGTVVGLTCDPSYHASIIPAVQTCNNGVLGPPLQCLPNTCPDIAFLLLPGDTMAPLQFKTFDPVATMPTYPIVFDTSLVLTCTGFGVVLVDSGPFQYCQNAQNFAMLGELVTLTCLPSGEYSVSMLLLGAAMPTDYVVNTPNALKCSEIAPYPAACAAVGAFIPIG